MWLVSVVYSVPRQSFGSISLLFSGYTISLPGRVFGEQQGGAAEILSRIGVEMETNPIYTSSGGIRTYLHLLDSIGTCRCNVIFYITR